MPDWRINRIKHALSMIREAEHSLRITVSTRSDSRTNPCNFTVLIPRFLEGHTK